MYTFCTRKKIKGLSTLLISTLIHENSIFLNLQNMYTSHLQYCDTKDYLSTCGLGGIYVQFSMLNIHVIIKILILTNVNRTILTFHKSIHRPHRSNVYVLQILVWHVMLQNTVGLKKYDRYHQWYIVMNQSNTNHL